MNSFIITPNGLSLVLNFKPYTVSKDHPQYAAILNALRAKDWDSIPGLYNALNLVRAGSSNIFIDAESGVLLLNGKPLSNAAVKHAIRLAEDGFDVDPLYHFIENLESNPNKNVIPDVYLWMQHNNITLSSTGCLIAYKYVRHDMTSVHDSKTLHVVGEMLSMPREECDESGETCSSGLHFCSHEYLPHFADGQGTLLLLEINPRDIVSIPKDYDSAKGRACQYKVIAVLGQEDSANVMRSDVLQTSLLNEESIDGDNSVSIAFKNDYISGYKDGKAHKAKRLNKTPGYEAGYHDGRKKLPMMFGDIVILPSADDKKIDQQVRMIIAEQIGLSTHQTNSPRIEEEANALMDSLDIVEIIMALEDEFNIMINNDDAENFKTVADIVKYVKEHKND